ncbi:hypothetical protein [Polynucleobacter necessarius]|uniref:hypothetical protein n=1 Tax=Polynucleobacter necessarius TaxID=576610 RepID=UPI001E50CD31|nr:hypothetical protein [Polynucleobacter necessarius]
MSHRLIFHRDMLSVEQAFLFSFQLGLRNKLDGGNLAGIVSWGRWANGNVIVADYNDGNLIAMPANEGFHFIVAYLITA